MTPGERRVLARALIVLTVAGVGRLVADARRPPLDVLAHLPDRGAELDSAATAAAAEEAERTRPLEPDERLDANRATAVALDRLPGVGPALAARIVAHRDEGGPFTSVDDLERVPGIGPATLARLRPHLEVRGAVTSASRPRAGRPREAHPLLDVNRADSAALLEISGIGPALAGRILDHRRRNGPYRTLDALQEVKGIGAKTVERLRRHLTAGPGV